MEIHEVEDHLGAVERTVSSLERDGKPARAVTLARSYKTTVEDTMRRTILVATYGRLGRLREAGDALEELLAISPNLEVDPMSELQRIYLSDEMIEGFAEGLRLAGLDLDPAAPAEAP